MRHGEEEQHGGRGRHGGEERRGERERHGKRAQRRKVLLLLRISHRQQIHSLKPNQIFEVLTKNAKQKSKKIRNAKS